MKAFVIRGKEDCFFTEVEKPQIRDPKDVIVKVKSAGICGTDLHIYEGQHSMSIGVDRIPGHEFSGEVVETGSGVTDLKVGDRVVHEPISYCGTCYACRRGQGNVCRSLKVTGCNMSGGWQEYYCAPEKQWHKISDWMTWKEAALVEPYTIAAQTCAQADVTAGDWVLIHGGGPIGLMCCDTIKHMGGRVIVSEIIEGRLKLARELGADYAVDPRETDLKKLVSELTDGEGVNVILDCAGLARMMNDNMEMLSPAGRFVPVAPAPVKIDDPVVVMAKQITFIGSRLQMNQFVPVISRFEMYKKAADLMITDTFPFEESDRAFAFAAAKNPETGKVVVLFDEGREMDAE